MEQRRSSDVQIGYLTGKVEEIGSLLAKVDERAAALEKKVDEKFTTVETTFKIIKWVTGIVVAIVTLRFSEVGVLWEAIFK